MAQVHHTAEEARPRSKKWSPSCTLADKPLHRIAHVREREGVSLRGVSRKMKVQVRELKQQERENADLRLSDLYRWQQVLEVPIADCWSSTTKRSASRFCVERRWSKS